VNRLFVFSIGGTGSRVLKSLAHLMAAGIRVHDSNRQPMELVPILIDTDATNRDTLSCVSLLELYESIHGERSKESGASGFFSASIRRLASFADAESGGVSRTFRSDFQAVEHTTFDKFIAFDQIRNLPTKYMLEALYSKENLNEELTGGFLGNPNVGATVLAAFKDSPDFRLFAKEFSAGDRIFVINSIFGGTGAAGLPWLLKWLRSDQQSYGSAESIRNAVIGALTVLPYFKLKDDDSSRIDSTSFITKTKAALSYYHGHIKNLNSLYYIADAVQATYANHESGEQQENPAHIVELLGAIAILDFAATSDAECIPAGRGYYEFALSDDAERLTFSSLGNGVEHKIGRQLTQMQMFSLLERSHFPASGHQPWAKLHNITSDLLLSDEYLRGVGKYLGSYYRPWIEQLDANRRAFSPFNLATEAKDMTKLLVGRPPAPKEFFKPKVGAELFDAKSSLLKGEMPSRPGTVARLLDIAWHGTQEVTNSLSLLK
jgi:hypothetical protein